MITDTFGNVLAPGTYFTYVVNSRYPVLKIAKVPFEGQPLRGVDGYYGKALTAMKRPNPTSCIVAIDERLLPESVKALLA